MGFLLLTSGGVASPVHTMTPKVYSIGAVTSSTQLPSYAVTLTAYNAVPEQTDDDPLVTASGAYSNHEIVAARSRDLAEELPFGTIIEVDGTNASKETCGYDVVAPLIGYRVIADTMNARFTDRIDILFSTKSNYTLSTGAVKNAGLVLGICDGIVVRVVGHIDTRTLPKTQMELVAIVRGSNNTFALK